MNNYPLLIEFVQVPASAANRRSCRSCRSYGMVPWDICRLRRRSTVPCQPIRSSSPGMAVVPPMWGSGGMSRGMEDGQLVFFRVRDLQPEELLSPAWSKDDAQPHMVAHCR